MRYRVRVDFNYWNTSKTEINEGGVDIFYVDSILDLPKELETFLSELNLEIAIVKKIYISLVINTK
jgi:hypothetical protein